MLSEMYGIVNMLPTGYRRVESCSSCAHCILTWDPESWSGYCNFANDIPEDSPCLPRTPEGDRRWNWEWARRIQPDMTCDYYENGKPQEEDY